MSKQGFKAGDYMKWQDEHKREGVMKIVQVSKNIVYYVYMPLKIHAPNQKFYCASYDMWYFFKLCDCSGCAEDV